MQPALSATSPPIPTGLVRIIIVVTAISAAVMELIDVTIVNVALNEIAGALGATIEDVAWVVTSYAIANVIIIPMTGFLADYFGRKKYYVGSIILFTVASYFCASSTSLWQLVFWRFIQGMGGGRAAIYLAGHYFRCIPTRKTRGCFRYFWYGNYSGTNLGAVFGWRDCR